MKILHTSDWHLGQIFKNQHRYEEHSLFLEYLLDKLQSDSYDILIIAGDVFDVGNPPSEALKSYYNFLIEASKTPLKQVVVIAGNHDFASTLEAPKELLNSLDIRVVGLLGRDYKESIIEVEGSHGVSARVFCAPYLRASDLKPIQEGESIEGSIKRSVKECYEEGLSLCQANDFRGVKIATGHLYAAGSEEQDSVRKIQIGKEGQVGVESFPSDFDYIALGHIHRAQLVNKNEHIRYSGSPIPLSFSEYQDKKYLIEVSWTSPLDRQIQMVEIPNFRTLRKIRGSRADVYNAISEIAEYDQASEKLNTWVEVVLPEEVPDPNLAAEIREFATEHHVKVFGVMMEKGTLKSSLQEQRNLNLLEPEDVFELIIENREDQEELRQTFQELEQLHRESE